MLLVDLSARNFRRFIYTQPSNTKNHICSIVIMKGLLHNNELTARCCLQSSIIFVYYIFFVGTICNQSRLSNFAVKELLNLKCWSYCLFFICFFSKDVFCLFKRTCCKICCSGRLWSLHKLGGSPWHLWFFK